LRVPPGRNIPVNTVSASHVGTEENTPTFCEVINGDTVGLIDWWSGVEAPADTGAFPTQSLISDCTSLPDATFR